MADTKHIWSFSTVGGVKRVNLETGADLKNLEHLDPKLWTALSCPVNDLEIDKKTLEIIDTDKDGQIRVPEVIEALKWILNVLKSPDDLLKQDGTFPLSAINTDTEDGKILLNSAKIILKNLGKEDANCLTVEETADREKIFAGSKFNGDGVITEDSTADADIITLINEILLYGGAVIDRGGKQGITGDIIAGFIENCEKFSAWHLKKENDYAGIFRFGDATENAYENFLAIKSKVSDFFIRCRLAAFDVQQTEILNLQVAQVEQITAKDLSNCLDEIAGYPLAKIEANKALPLTSGINPAWEKAISEFKRLTVMPLFKEKESITEMEWNMIVDSFAEFAKWKSEKEGANVEPLGIERVKTILAGSYKEQLFALIEEDKALENEVNNIIQVDKLVRYYRDIFTLIKNFVTFFDFYSKGTKAIFQAGTLYIDQRSCDLCIRVRDMSKHATLASFSGMYLIYCDCKSKTTSEKMTILAALTNGDIDNLMVGRNALFYDRKGLDWDATIVKIVDNPISIRQAFFSPYRKSSRFIEKQVSKIAASEDEKVHSNMTKSVEGIPMKTDDAKAKKEPPPPFDVGKFVGIFAAIGLAIGAIGTALASVIGGFMGLVWWKMPFAIMGLLLLISGPAMVIAYLNLRKRNLAPLLDANGWAINARVVVNIQFGNVLTHIAELPKGAKININDPFSKKKRPFLPAILLLSIVTGIVLYLLWKYGFIHVRI